MLVIDRMYSRWGMSWSSVQYEHHRWQGVGWQKRSRKLLNDQRGRRESEIEREKKEEEEVAFKDLRIKLHSTNDAVVLHPPKP